MEVLRWNVKFSLLGIIAAVSMSAHMILIMLDPVAMKLAGEWSDSAGRADWVMMTLFWLGPLWLAFAALVWHGLALRRAVFAASTLLAVLSLWHFFICAVPVLKGGPYPTPTAHHILLVGSSAVATALMAWYARKRPAPQA